MGLDIVLAEAPYPSSPLGFYSCYLFSCYIYGLASCHSYCVGPLGLLPLSLGFHGLFTLLLLLIMSMGLLVVIPTMLASWVYHFFPWVSMTYLLYFYLLLCLWAYWLLFLPCWPVVFITSFFGLPRPIYFTFTFYCAYGPIDYYSRHVGPLG